MNTAIKIRGARQHNLKNISVDIPKNKLICFTGVSGSGKSSLAFDTIYAEGQRRYVETLSTYARQFLGVMKKPDIDLIEGLSPAISIDQKRASKNPRSTVGTVTEIYDYLRLLFAKIGHPHCPICKREIASQSLDEIVEACLKLIRQTTKDKKTARFMILSPVVIDKKGEFNSLFENLKAKGFTQVRIDKKIKDLSDDFVLIKTNKHTIEAVIDRISFSPQDLKDAIFQKNLISRLTDSIQQSLKLSDGLVILAEVNDAAFSMPKYPKHFSDHLFSQMFACPIDNIQIAEIEPRTFSFNSPHGACNKCGGIGKIQIIDTNLAISPEISITEGGILPFANIFENDTWYARLILQVCAKNNINPKTPLKNLTKKQVNILLKGTGDCEYKVRGTNRFDQITHIRKPFPGIIHELEKRHRETSSDWVRVEIAKYMREKTCPSCAGARLNSKALNISVDRKNISEATSLTISNVHDWIKKLMGTNSPLSPREVGIANLILKEISTRLDFLLSVGLDYLTLDRPAGTLAGGESQRIRLASQIGTGLSGVLYVLDEPTIGLHQKDNQKLINTLKKLRDLENTVVVVEHDEKTIRQSDYVVDFGPGAGKEGGTIVDKGTPKHIARSKKSLTGKYLSGKKKVKITNESLNDTLFSTYSTNYPDRQKSSSLNLSLHGCQQYNLKNINVSFPLGKLVAITGVSGSGKSTLLVETLYPALQEKLIPRFRGLAGKHKYLEGIENVNRVILIDQSPIGRTPRSNPATYTKLFDFVRNIFASTKQSRANGLKKGHFSFNVKGGRCEACEGQGLTKIEMQFMNDIWITCEVCEGKRYNTQTLEVHYKGKDISQILSLTVSEAREFFHNHPPIVKKLDTLNAVGLNYIELGQPATTLSGGEAQRIKLSAELAKRDTGKTVFILDEPTTGLHFADVEKLLKVLKLLVRRGNSVFIIEHNLDVIKNSDWIIDLGPEGGEGGGYIVAEGTIGDLKKCKKSFTGQFLSKK
jgi:excinuclease ABC subunit A